MTVESTKYKMSIQRETDIERLRKIALHLNATVATITGAESGPDNYSVMSPHYDGYDWFEKVRGTRDYCIGYYEAANDHQLVVTCGDFVTYPEDRFGEHLTGRIEW